MHRFVRGVYTLEWDNEVTGESLEKCCFSFLLVITERFRLLSPRCCYLPLLCSLTAVLYMVRASVHVGDPAELCDTGHVSSL